MLWFPVFYFRTEYLLPHVLLQWKYRPRLPQVTSNRACQVSFLYYSSNNVVYPANKFKQSLGDIAITLSVPLSVCLTVHLFASCMDHYFLPLFESRSYFTQLLFMTQGCVMTFTQGHISKVKVTMHTWPKTSLLPCWISVICCTIVDHNQRVFHGNDPRSYLQIQDHSVHCTHRQNLCPAEGITITGK